jgi:hypothetical protein
MKKSTKIEIRELASVAQMTREGWTMRGTTRDASTLPQIQRALEGTSQVAFSRGHAGNIHYWVKK